MKEKKMKKRIRREEMEKKKRNEEKWKRLVMERGGFRVLFSK